MKHLIVILLLFGAEWAWAQTLGYGYVRVVLRDINLQHSSVATLQANGVDIAGIQFSHNNHGRPLGVPYDWVALGVQNLNASANSTTIRAVYKLERGCYFKYQIQFSFDQQNIVYTSPVFEAPNDQGIVTIPIGTRCETGMRVCSADLNLQRQLENAYKKSLVTSYNIWKANYDKQLRNRVQKSEQSVQKASSDLKRLRNPDFEKGRKLLKELSDKWQLEFEAKQAEAARLEEGLKADHKDGASDTQKIADQAVENAKLQQGQQALRGTSETVKEGFRTLVQMDKELLEALKEDGDGSASPQMVRGHEVIKQGADLMIHDYLEGGAVQKIIPGMVSTASMMFPEIKALSMLGTSIKICKIWGQELCYGPELTAEERAQALCELVGKYVVKNGLGFKKMLERMSKEDKAIAEQVESLSRSGLCSRITKP